MPQVYVDDMFSGISVLSFKHLVGEERSVSFTAGFCKIQKPELYCIANDPAIAQVAVRELTIKHLNNELDLGVHRSIVMCNMNDDHVRFSVREMNKGQVYNVMNSMNLVTETTLLFKLDEAIEYGIYQIVGPDNHNVLPGEKGYVGSKPSEIETIPIQ